MTPFAPPPPLQGVTCTLRLIVITSLCPRDGDAPHCPFLAWHLGVGVPAQPHLPPDESLPSGLLPYECWSFQPKGQSPQLSASVSSRPPLPASEPWSLPTAVAVGGCCWLPLTNPDAPC